jgi:3-hydroxy-3-methylglutaryl CoA synthase
MPGITSYGVYFPYYRLSRADIGAFWGGYQLPGERAVANFDEDTLTMAVEAGRECLKGTSPKAVDGLFIASTTLPYSEKQNAVLAATVLDVNQDVRTADISGSLRSGTTAVSLALDSVKSGTARNVLVCASDLRLGMPNGSKELEFGDGAAALMIGASDVIATIDHVSSFNNELYDVYRPASERFVRSWEDRFVREMGYTKIVPHAAKTALSSLGMEPREFSKGVFSAPNPTYLATAAKLAGFDPKTQCADPLWGVVGNLGSAHAPALLAAALEQAKPGERLLWVNYGDGCDIMVLTVTDFINDYNNKKQVMRMAISKANTTYQKYLRWRDLVNTEPPMRPKTEPASAPALYRDRLCGLALYGSKCRNCGTVQYPIQRICMECRTKDDYEMYPFADKQGKIITFSHDNLAVSPDPPTTLAAVDFDGGGRMMLDITDRDPSKIEIGMPVEMTFRKFRFTEGIQVYWWKSRPLR